MEQSKKIYLLPWHELLDRHNADVVGDVVQRGKRRNLWTKELERKHGHKHVVDVAHRYEAGVPLVPAARRAHIAHKGVGRKANERGGYGLEQKYLLFIKIA